MTAAAAAAVATAAADPAGFVRPWARTEARNGAGRGLGRLTRKMTQGMAWTINQTGDSDQMLAGLPLSLPFVGVKIESVEAAAAIAAKSIISL